MKKLVVVFLVLFSINTFSQKFEGLAETPPLGWNSWNTFATDINEELVKNERNQFIS